MTSNTGSLIRSLMLATSFCLGTLVLGDDGTQRTNAADAEPKAVRVTASVVINGAMGEKVHPVELGVIPFDQPVSIEVQITNEGSESLTFDQVEVSCSCTRAEVPQGHLEAGKTIVCKIRLDPAKQQRTHLLSSPIRLSNSGNPNEHLVLLLKGYLEGFLSFVDPYVTAELTEGKKLSTVAIPFFATRPIVGDLVSVELDPSLGTCQLEPARGEKDRWNLLLSVPNERVPKEGAAVLVTLDDFATGRSASTTVMLRHDPPVIISPRSVRLAPNSVGDRYEGSVVLTVRRPGGANIALTDEAAPVAAGVRVKPRDPFVAAKLDGKLLRIKSTRLNDEHFRVVVFVAKDLLVGALDESEERIDEENKLDIRWSITSELGSHQVATPVSFASLDGK